MVKLYKFLLAFLTPLALFGQDCISFNDQDTVICGYETLITASPNGGTWEFLCDLSDGPVETNLIGLNIIKANVGACGSYFFSYSVSGGNCNDTDTIQIDFYSKDNRDVLNEVSYNLNYDPLSYYQDKTLCGPSVLLNGLDEPTEKWTLDWAITCQSQIFTSNFGNFVVDGCEVDQYNYDSIAYSGSLSDSQIFNQDSFNYGGTFDLIEYTDSIFQNNNSVLNEQCPPPDRCFMTPPECLELAFDTIFYELPIREGGCWNAVDNGIDIPLSDTSIISYNGDSLWIHFLTGSNYFGPNNVQIAFYEIDNGAIVGPTDTLEVTLVWKEKWSTETYTEIRRRRIIDPDCLQCGYNNTIPYNIEPPNIPFYQESPFTLTILPSPDFSFVGDTLICDDASASLCIEPDFDSYEWSTSATTQCIAITEGGIYGVTVTGENGCENEGFQLVNVVDLENVNVVAESFSLCEGDCMDIEVNTSGSYQWSTGDTTQIINVCPPLGSTNYNVTVTKDGCSKVLQANFNVAASPFVSAGSDLVLNCDSTQFTVEGNFGPSNPNYEVFWQTPNGNIPGQTIVITSPGLYFFVVKDNEFNCSVSDPLAVTEDLDAPAIDAGPNQIITCQAQNVVLDGSIDFSSGSVDFMWSGPGIDASNATSTDPVVNIAGSYYLEAKNLMNGCISSDSVIVSSDNEVPIADAGENLVLDCGQSFVLINGSGSQSGPNIIYIWTGPGIDSSNINDITPLVNQAGNYNLQVLDTVNQCSSNSTMMVTLNNDIPNVNAGEDLFINCTTFNVNLQPEVDGDISDFSFMWMGPFGFSSTQVNPLVTDPGVYYLTVENINNACSKMDSVVVNDFEEISFAFETESSCASANSGEIRITQVFGGAAPIQYILENDPPTLIPLFENLAPGVYELRIVDAVGCSKIETILIDELDPIVFEIADEFTLCGESEIISIDASIVYDGELEYLWSNFENDPIAQYSLSDTLSGDEWVEISNGCETVREEFTIIDLSSGSATIDIPNLFAPDSDSDPTLKILSGGEISSFEFYIYDRWGNKVFETTDENAEWDGTFNGQAMPVDTYVWFYNADIIDCKGNVVPNVFKKGDVLLLR